MFLAVGLGILLSASGLLLEEISFHVYPRTRHLVILAMVVVLENFGYRQLNSWWRLVGLYRWAARYRRDLVRHLGRQVIEEAMRCRN